MNSVPQKIRCSHILLSWDDAINSTHSRDLVYAIDDAKKIIADLMSGSITWKVAVKEHSACSSYYKDGDLGWFEQHEITPEIWNACMCLDKGDLTPEPVQSPYGIHIITRTG